MSARFLGLALAGLLAAGPASAAVISFSPNTHLTATATTINLGGALYSFTAFDTGSGIGAAVSTATTAKVSSFFGGVTDFEAGSTIDGTGIFSFSAFPTATLIPNSVADDFIGLAYAVAGGIRYGYAEVNGATLVSYGVETTPGVAILTGAVAAPEPAAFAVLLVGLVGLGAMTRGRSTV